jgi:hypothetical protein
MNPRFPALKRILSSAVVACTLALSACDYDVPITANPTRRVDARLLGNWTLVSPLKSEHMKIRRFDDSNYVIAYQDGFYRAHHSDVADLPLVSVQQIEDQRKFVYFAWQLSDDGNRLTIKTIRASVVPKETRDSATVTKLIETNRANAQLFEDSFAYTRDSK